jgi:hypothetical protein
MMAGNEKCGNNVSGDVAMTLGGTVEKIIPPASDAEPEKVQIRVKRAGEFYGVIRIENTLRDAEGNSVALKNGVDVDMTITSNSNCITRKE